MWEKLKVYKQLDKKDINQTFKKFGSVILTNLNGYSLEQTNSVIKLSRQINGLEQAIFIEKDKDSYNLKVRTSIKPIDFYKHHKFTMVNIVSLGEIMNNHRRSSYPLTQEWDDLAIYLAARIKTEIENYFQEYDSFEKIIGKRNDIEPKYFGLENKFELLIYAAIRVKNKSLLNRYIKKKLDNPTMQITQSEYLKQNENEIDETEFLKKIQQLVLANDFGAIENEIARISLKVDTVKLASHGEKNN